MLIMENGADDGTSLWYNLEMFLSYRNVVQEITDVYINYLEIYIFGEE